MSFYNMSSTKKILPAEEMICNLTFLDLEKLILGSTIDAIREKLSADRDLLFATNRSGKTLLMSSTTNPQLLKNFYKQRTAIHGQSTIQEKTHTTFLRLLDTGDV